MLLTTSSFAAYFPSTGPPQGIEWWSSWHGCTSHQCHKLGGCHMTDVGRCWRMQIAYSVDQLQTWDMMRSVASVSYMFLIVNWWFFHHNKVLALMSVLKLLYRISLAPNIEPTPFFPRIPVVMHRQKFLSRCWPWCGWELSWTTNIDMVWSLRVEVVEKGWCCLFFFGWHTQTHRETYIWMLQPLGSVRSKSSGSEFFAPAKSRRGLCEYDGTT